MCFICHFGNPCVVTFHCKIFAPPFIIITPPGSSNAYSENEDMWEQEHVFAVPCFPDGHGNPRALITMSSSMSNEPVNVSLSIPELGFEISRNLTKDSSPCDIDLSPDNVGHDIPSCGEGQGTTIIVRSSSKVNVHAIINDFVVEDGFVVIPTNQLGTTHYLASYQPSSDNDPAFVYITAVQMNTSVYVHTKTRQLNLPLQKYESFRFEGGRYEDLSGSLVESNKPIAVISGVHAKVQGNLNDTRDVHRGSLLVQIPPINMWGVKFSIPTVPFQSSDLNGGCVYRIQTLNISTYLKMSGTDTQVIEIRPEVKSFHEVNCEGDAVISFTSNQPVMVIEFLKRDFSQSPTLGDPAMLIVPPVEQYTSNVTFPVFEFDSRNEQTYYITVLAACTAFDDGFRLDETSIDWNNRQQSVHNAVCYSSHRVTTGQHSLTHIDPTATFYVSVYGICQICDSSYAYSANAYDFQGRPNHYLSNLYPIYYYYVLVRHQNFEHIGNIHTK